MVVIKVLVIQNHSTHYSGLGDEVFYSLQTADRRNIDILDDNVVVVPSQSITERRRLDQSGDRLRHFESTRGTSRMSSIDSMYVHSL